MIYAVVTLDNVLLYDTQQQAPFACIAAIHYEQLTDASWYVVSVWENIISVLKRSLLV